MSIRDRMRHRGRRRFPSLRRYPQDGWVAGVCAGLAEYFDFNVKLLRFLVVLSLIFSGFFPVGVIYLALWYLMDEAPGRVPDDDVEDYGQHYRPEPARPAAAPTMTEVKTRFARMEGRLRSMEECVASQDFELRRELRKLEG